MENSYEMVFCFIEGRKPCFPFVLQGFQDVEPRFKLLEHLHITQFTQEVPLCRFTTNQPLDRLIGFKSEKIEQKKSHP